MKFDTRLCEYINALPGEFDPDEEAQRFLAITTEDHADELDEWIEAHTLVFVRSALTDRLRQDRSRATSQRRAKEFHDHIDDPDALVDMFHATYSVDGAHLRKRVAEMTGPDHVFVASEHEAKGNKRLLLAAFHRAVAKKIGKKQTAEVFTVEQYEEMYRSIVEPSEAAVA